MARGDDTALPFDPIEEAKRNWESRDWAASEAMAAVTSIERAHRIVLGRVDDVLRPFGLTFARYEALVLLVFSRRGMLPLGKMGERLQVHPASVTNAIDRLEVAGLVRRVAHPTDRRAVLAEITETGRKRVDAATAALGAIRFGIEGLTDDAARAVTSELTTLRRSAGDF
jgi:DNA-binding MarR family transcriptional regulator